MTEPQVLHDRLMTKLHHAVAEVVDIDGGSEEAIEVAATGLTDALATVLVRLPAAATGEGAGIIAEAMGLRMVRKMAAEILLRGSLIDLSAAKAFAPPTPPAASGGRHRPRRLDNGGSSK